GWRWMIAFSCAWMNFFHRGLIRSMAVVYVQLIQTFGITREEAALPLSLVSVIAGCSGLSVGVLMHYLNDRILVVIATLISATGLVLCYTATNMTQINFYYSISQGLGTGLVFTLTAVILNNVFKKNRATASGINLSGPTLVALVFPVLFQYCSRKYGLRGAFLIASGFTLNALPAAFLLSSKIRKPIEPVKEVEPEIIKNPRYDCEINMTGSTFTLADVSGSTSDIPSKPFIVSKSKNIRAKEPLAEKEKLLDHSASEDRKGKAIVVIANGTTRPKSQEIPIDYPDTFNSAERASSIPIVKGNLPKMNDKLSKVCGAMTMFKDMFSSPYFLLVTLSQVSHVFNHSTFITIIIDYAKDHGIDPEQGIYILLANSGGDLVGRLGLGWISDKKLIERRNMMLLNYLFTGILMHLAPYCNSYSLLTALAVTMALCGGSTITLFSVLFLEYLGIRLMPLAYGLSNFITGNANFFRPKIIG
ncbi:monocarboxylate transporter, putative, partial [Ixodes scapularis]